MSENLLLTQWNHPPLLYGSFYQTRKILLLGAAGGLELGSPPREGPPSKGEERAAAGGSLERVV